MGLKLFVEQSVIERKKNFEKHLETAFPFVIKNFTNKLQTDDKHTLQITDWIALGTDSVTMSDASNALHRSQYLMLLTF